MLADTFLFSAPGTLAAALVAGLFGLLIGSFLNVVVYRLPKMWQREQDNDVAEINGKPPVHTDRFTLAVPRSACPHCGHQITALENIPVVSYVALGGKCSACKAPISLRYPAIELATGLLSALVIWHFGSGYEGLSALLFTYLLLAMSFIDFDTQFLPDDMTLPLLWAGLLVNLYGLFAPLDKAVTGAAAGYMILWLINAAYKLVKRQEGMGGGDFKLLAALGAWMGWNALPAIILLSSVVGSIVGISLIVFAKYTREVRIPFGPYLAAAGFIVLLYGKEITAMTQGFLQLG
jgi:leader peptidase (prepilin peptidase) / N-methyltransferase